MNQRRRINALPMSFRQPPGHGRPEITALYRLEFRWSGSPQARPGQKIPLGFRMLPYRPQNGSTKTTKPPSDFISRWFFYGHITSKALACKQACICVHHLEIRFRMTNRNPRFTLRLAGRFPQRETADSEPIVLKHRVEFVAP